MIAEICDGWLKTLATQLQRVCVRDIQPCLTAVCICSTAYILHNPVQHRMEIELSAYDVAVQRSFCCYVLEFGQLQEKPLCQDLHR